MSKSRKTARFLHGAPPSGGEQTPCRAALRALCAAIFILFAVFSAARAQEAPLVVNSGRADAQTSPAAAADGDNVFAAWQSNVSGEWQVYFAASGDGGKTFSPEKCLSCGVAGAASIHREPAVAAAPGGKVLVAWQGISDDKDYDILTAFSADGGKTFGAPVRANSSKAGNQGFPAAASMADGSFIVVWHDNRTGPGEFSIYAARTEDGKTFAPEIQVSGAAPVAGSAWPAIAPGPRSTAAAAWQCGPAICIAESKDSGKTFLPAREAFRSAPGAQFPALTFGADGELWIAFERQDAERHGLDVYISRADSAAGEMSEPAPANASPAGHQSAPSVVSIGPRAALIAWQDGRSIGGYDIYSATAEAGTVTMGLSGETRRDASDTGFSTDPVLAATGDAIYLLWQDDTTGDYDIYLKKIR